MKYEHVLQVYWLKGFFYSTKLFYFDQSFLDIFLQTAGLGEGFKSAAIKRFELTFFRKKFKSMDVIDYQKTYGTMVMVPLNVIFSQVYSINHELPEVVKLNILRLYLVKSFRGKCHALGKPVHGQRTWSNAWSSYKNNSTLRNFISETQKQIQKTKRIEKIDYKMTQKKYATKKKRRKSIEKKVEHWF